MPLDFSLQFSLGERLSARIIDRLSLYEAPGGGDRDRDARMPIDETHLAVFEDSDNAFSQFRQTFAEPNEPSPGCEEMPPEGRDAKVLPADLHSVGSMVFSGHKNTKSGGHTTAVMKFHRTQPTSI